MRAKSRGFVDGFFILLIYIGFVVFTIHENARFIHEFSFFSVDAFLINSAFSISILLILKKNKNKRPANQKVCHPRIFPLIKK